MSPFDLPGPAFLLFFSVVASGIVGFHRLLLTTPEGGPAPTLSDVDTYLVAWLRDGPKEGVRVAIVSLIDRGFITVNNHAGRRSDPELKYPHEILASGWE